MKDVKEALSQKLQSFNKDVSPARNLSFNDLFKFLNENKVIHPIVEAIAEEKREAHQAALKTFRQYISEAKKQFSFIRKELQNFIPLLTSIDEAMLNLSRMILREQKIYDLHYALEKEFIVFREEHEKILRHLIEQEIGPFVAQLATFSCSRSTRQLQIKITIPSFLSCLREMELLSVRRISSLWGIWDTLMWWYDEVKEEICPSNEPLLQNLNALFHHLKIPDKVRIVSETFLDRIAHATNKPDLKKDPLINYEEFLSVEQQFIEEKVAIHALELFLDKKDRYWILVHLKSGDRVDLFIKKVKEGLPKLLLKRLLAKESSSIEHKEELSVHTLGELGIKGELKKVFFQKERFQSHFVELDSFKKTIDQSAIIRQLSSLKKKNPPKFPLGDYVHS